MGNDSLTYIEAKKMLEDSGLSTNGFSEALVLSVAKKWEVQEPLSSDEVEKLKSSIPKFFRNPKEHNIVCNWKLSDYVKWLKMGLFEYVSPNDDVDFYCSLMGAYDFVNWFEGNIEILVHGTSSCIASYRITRPDFMGNKSLYCTGIQEKDIIFGANKKLQEAIREIYRRKTPELLIVLTTCATDIIGEDISSVIDDMSDLNMKIVMVTTGGCSGLGFREGANLVLKKLLDILPGSVGKQKDINLLYFPLKDPEALRTETEEIVKILSDGGLRINTVITRGTTLNELYQIPKARAIVGVCPTKSDRFIEIIREKYGQAQFSLLPPIGYKAMEEWVHTLSRALGTGEAKSIPALVEMRAEAMQYIEKHQLKGRRVVIFLPPGRSFPIARFFKQLGARPIIMGIKPFQLKAVSNIVEKMIMQGDEVEVFLGGFTELVNYLQEKEECEALVIVKKKLPVFNCFMQVCLDFFFKPIYGISGQTYIFSQLDRAMDNINNPDRSIFNSFFPEDCYSPEEVGRKSSCGEMSGKGHGQLQQKIQWRDDLL